MKKTILLSASLIAAVISISTVAQAGSHPSPIPKPRGAHLPAYPTPPKQVTGVLGGGGGGEHYATKKPPDVTSRIKASALTEPRRDTRSAPGLLW